MRKIKSFDTFINEEGGWGGAFLSTLGQADPFGFKGGASSDKPDKVETAPPATPITSSPTSPTTPTVTATNLEVVNAVPGNDDFMLYMQHQQGMGGAKGLLAASAGTGSIHPETLKVKVCSHLGGRVPYANLQCNIPSDRPQYKKDIVAALNAGDQKTGASLFLKMWKEKWNDKTKQAKQLINEPKHAELKALINQYCTKYGVPFDFACTVALIESGFNPNAGNSRYKGIYALSDKEFKEYVPGGNIKNMNDNVNAGIQCLKNNIKQFTKYLGPLLAKIDVGSWAKTA